MSVRSEGYHNIVYVRNHVRVTSYTFIKFLKYTNDV